MWIALLLALGLQAQPALAESLPDLTDEYIAFLQTCTDPADERKYGVEKYQQLDILTGFTPSELPGELKDEASGYVLLIENGEKVLQPQLLFIAGKEPSNTLGDRVHSAIYTRTPDSADAVMVTSALIFQTAKKGGYFSIAEFAIEGQPELLGGNYCEPGQVSTVYFNSGIAYLRKEKGN